MMTAEMVTLADLAARADAMLPTLRERAPLAEALRRLPDQTIDDFKKAGFFRVFVPKRYGGYELDYGITQIELSSRLGRACGSSAWVQAVVAVHAWIVAMLPEAAQDAVWSTGPDTLITTAVSPLDGTIQRVDGGYRLQGQWQFSSGIDAAAWVLFSGPLEDAPDRRAPWCLVHRSEWQIVDTWHAAGLKGTGSQDVRIRDAFVPDAWTAEGAERPGTRVNHAYIYRLPFWPIYPYNIVCPALGIARGAVEEYVAATAARPDRANSVPRQLRIAESTAEVDAALALLRADAAEIVELGRAGGDVPPEVVHRWGRNLSYTVVLCTRAVDRLADAVGAHGLSADNSFQRAYRDLHALINHNGNQWDLRSIPFARTVLGLDPGVGA